LEPIAYRYDHHGPWPLGFKGFFLAWGWGMTAVATASMSFALWNLYEHSGRFNAEVAWCAFALIIGLALAFFRRVGRAVWFGDFMDDFAPLTVRWRHTRQGQKKSEAG
jgi:hypothetical protein